MLSIVHVVSSLNLGGAERFVVDLASVQRAAGIDASILSFGGHEDFLVKEAEQRGIPYNICPAKLGRRKLYPALYRSFSTVDVLQIHAPSTLQYLFPLLMLRATPKVIYTRHGEGKSELRWKLMHWVTQRCVDLATFVSKSAHDAFVKRSGWHSHDLRVIENGVYIPQAKKSEKRHPIRFGSVGRMVDIKGQPHLLNAIDQLRFSDAQTSPFELHFFGSGPMEAELREHAARNSNSGSIFFHGSVMNRDKIYESIDVLVVSSESEGLSLVILEAMARGIPVIATAVGGNVELVKPDVNGYLVNYGCAETMTAALGKMIDHPEKINVFGESARQMVIEKYSIEKTHREYLQCYIDLSHSAGELGAHS